jgi:hypothetical protein
LKVRNVIKLIEDHRGASTARPAATASTATSPVP